MSNRNDFQDRDVVISEDITDKGIVEIIQQMFDEHWVKNVSYGLHRLKVMKKGKLFLPKSLQHVLAYLHELEAPLKFQSSEAIESAIKEVKYWEEQHGYCIYMSVLLQTLINELDKKESSKVAYYQGFSDVLTENPMAKMVFGKRQLGLHAWITYENKVVDVTAHQHMHSVDFDFKNPYQFVIGEYPDSYRLAGFKEPETTIREYQELFASQVNLSREEWINKQVDSFNHFKQKLSLT